MQRAYLNIIARSSLKERFTRTHLPYSSIYIFNALQDGETLKNKMIRFVEVSVIRKYSKESMERVDKSLKESMRTCKSFNFISILRRN